MWLDAQWSEEYILRGAKEYFRSCKPYILMEYWPVTKYHSDGKTISKAAPGNKKQLLNDEVFKKIFQENNICISNDKTQFEDILLEFKSIIIGSSKTNTKIIKLDKIYPKDTELKFIHNYKDTFTYIFNNNELSITRTDEIFGWGQDLIGYL